jgi:hypothetical protein
MNKQQRREKRSQLLKAKGKTSTLELVARRQKRDVISSCDAEIGKKQEDNKEIGTKE